MIIKQVSKQKTSLILITWMVSMKGPSNKKVNQEKIWVMAAKKRIELGSTKIALVFKKKVKKTLQNIRVMDMKANLKPQGVILRAPSLNKMSINKNPTIKVQVLV